ncbi:hypothetical protein ACF053_27435 [Streptomyces kanasensis]|uniref:hypothetical protein n=1 Tax=Streptomyces kanasensis TaxID=936756 RepID=UPI0036FFF3CD
MLPRDFRSRRWTWDRPGRGSAFVGLASLLVSGELGQVADLLDRTAAGDEVSLEIGGQLEVESFDEMADWPMPSRLAALFREP